MKALVTGATGFIGNVVWELLRQGYQVTALVRKESNRRNLEVLDIEVVYGDLQDVVSLETALAGCDYLFHVATAYALLLDVIHLCKVWNDLLFTVGDSRQFGDSGKLRSFQH